MEPTAHPYAPITEQLAALGWPAELENTGGGCLAIVIPLADDGYAMLTVAEPLPERRVPIDDEDSPGFDNWHLGIYDADGEFDPDRMFILPIAFHDTSADREVAERVAHLLK